jgi:thiol:disulfide interchange protein
MKFLWIPVTQARATFTKLSWISNHQKAITNRETMTFFYIEPLDPALSEQDQTLSPLKDFLEKYNADTGVQMILKGRSTQSLEEVRLRVHFQICDYQGICFLPNSQDLNLVNPSFTGDESPNLWLTLLLALLGGLALNIMPCIYPLIPIKVMTLLKLKEEGAQKPILASLAYGGGIVLSLLAISVLVMILVSSGGFFIWGSAFQNPWFILVITALLLAFAMSLFGAYTLSLVSGKNDKPSGLGGEFLSGLFAVFVAAPCTAPFLGGALSATLTLPLYLIPVIFIFVGLGFALPYFLLTVIPGLVQIIPKPGAWMEKFERVMGFVLIGAALYYLSLLMASYPSPVILGVLVFLVILSFLLWVWGHFFGPTKTVGQNLLATALLFVTVGLTGWFTLDFRTEQPAPSETTIGGEDFDPSDIPALLLENNAVLVDVWASWCTQCKINEEAVFSQEEVQEFLQTAGVALLKADATRPSPAIEAYLASIKKVGLPVYALYTPDKPVKFLPQSFSSNEFKALISQGLSSSQAQRTP